MQNLQESSNSNNGGDHTKSGSFPSSITTTNKNPTMPPAKMSELQEKELINCGLHKLVSNFSIATKLSQKPIQTIHSKNTETSTKPTTSPEKQPVFPVVCDTYTATNKHTMTDFDETEPSTPNKKQYKDLQWTDPKLKKKHSHRGKKSRTIPHVDKSDYGSDIANYDSDDDEGEYRRDTKNMNANFLLRCLYFFCTTSVSFVGSVCGITLITMVLWKTLDYTSFVNLRLYFEPAKELTYLDTFKSAIKTVTDIF